MTTTTTPTVEPAAWPGCLSCYNNGTLTGSWISGPEIDLEAAGLADSTGRCLKCGGEEWQILDSEHVGAGELSIDEYQRRAAAVVQLEDEDDLVRIAFVDWAGENSWDVEAWRDAIVHVEIDGGYSSDEEILVEHVFRDEASIDLQELETSSSSRVARYAGHLQDAYAQALARDAILGGEMYVTRLEYAGYHGYAVYLAL